MQRMEESRALASKSFFGYVRGAELYDWIRCPSLWSDEQPQQLSKP